MLKLGGTLAAGAVAGKAIPSLGAQSDATLMRPAGYADVTLLDGPMLEQFAAQHRTLLAMDEDALLKPFRQAAGMSAPGENLGGWYNAAADFDPPASMHGFIPGHSFGQYLSGLSRAYAITGDQATKEKVERLVAGFAPTITPKFYDGYPLPAYTFDKTNIGLIDAHAFAGDETALRVLNQATDAALPHLPEKALTRPEMEARPHPNMAFTWDESYTLPHLRAAKNGFDFVVAQSFATGGWGPNEGFVVPGSGALGDSLHTTHAGFETPCGSYGHFKIARTLMAVTGDSRYGDSMERVLYNTILGALPMKADGTAFYYADYNASGSKTYFEYRCPCCSGTLGQIVADYAISSYFTNSRGVFVNLYTPSQLRWRLGGRAIVLRQTTQYPLDPEINFEVRTATPETFSVALRIPAWAGPNTMVAVNGRRLGAPIMPGRFLEIRRTWQGSDRIALVLDMPLRLEAVDDKHPNDLAVMQGPLALFAVGDRFLPFTRRDLSAVRQVAPRSAEWRASTVDGEQIFKPYFAVNRETTRLYQPVSA
jgi:DUF1680 family protein